MSPRVVLALAAAVVPLAAGVASAAPSPLPGCQAYSATGKASCTYVSKSGSIFVTGVAKRYQVTVGEQVRSGTAGAGILLTGIKKGTPVTLTVNTGVATVTDSVTSVHL